MEKIYEAEITAGNVVSRVDFDGFDDCMASAQLISRGNVKHVFVKEGTGPGGRILAKWANGQQTVFEHDVDVNYPVCRHCGCTDISHPVWLECKQGVFGTEVLDHVDGKLPVCSHCGEDYIEPA